MVDYSNYSVRRGWISGSANRKSNGKNRTKPFFPFLIIAFLAIVTVGLAFFTAGFSASGYRLTINPAYLEHNGITVMRPSRVYDGVASEYAETAGDIATAYQNISRVLVRISTDLQLSQTSPVGAVARIRNLEADALSAIATLGTMPDSEFKQAYTARFLYAVQRLGELTQDPTADRLWTVARELFVME